MKLHVVVPGQIVGKNQARRIDRKRGTSYVTREMKLWMRSVAVAAWMEAARTGWPDPFAVREASFFVQRYNVGGDADRGNEFLADALQFTRWWTPRGETSLPGPVGIVGNDKHLWNAGSPPAIKDEHGPRVEIVITLRAVHAPHVAESERERWYTNEARRALRKMDRLGNRELVRDRARTKARRDELALLEERTGMTLT